MALKQCKECGNEVSTKADNCPHCGARVKAKKRIGCLGVIGVIFLIGIIGSFIGSLGNKATKTSSSAPKVSAPVKAKTPEEIRQERIRKGFSLWDGSHRELEKIIKKSMNDPDSYVHVETAYDDKGDHLLVKTTFRGKNAFGGVVKNWVIAKADLDGNIIGIISKGP